jgi:hypothetical protein
MAMAIENWIDVVNATGIRAGRLDPATVYLLSGKILNDPIVVERKLKFLQGSVLPTGSAAKAIREMTEAERAELRSRIL